MTANPTHTHPEPGNIYADAAGCEWTVIGVHYKPSVILEGAHGYRLVPAIDSPLFQNMRAKAPDKCIACKGSGKTYPAIAGFAEPEHRGTLGPCGMCGGTGKASAPVTPERCEPADATIEQRIAALEAHSHAPVDMDVLIRQHLIVNGVIRATKHERDAAIKELGPVVASPSNTDIREPTDEAIERLYNENKDSLFASGKWLSNFAKLCVPHFSPTVSAEPTDEFAPGSFGCHEALHMASYFADAVHEGLRDHPAISRNPEWREQADRAITILADLYSKIGAQHFLHPQPATTNTSITNGLAQENASQPAVSQEQAQRQRSRDILRQALVHSGHIKPAAPAQEEPSDDEIHRVWTQNGARLSTSAGGYPTYDISAYNARLLTRKLIAKHHPSISDSQLKDLWKLAKTEELQVFLTDARGVVGR